MNIADQIRRQFTYDAWANREVLQAIRAGGEGLERPLQLLSHILSAERLWMERLNQTPQSLPVWPKFDLVRCESEIADLKRLWSEYLELITAGDLVQTISYKNSKGESWTSTIIDVLTHVVMHSSYHRGQIATCMRENGLTPAYTDFIHAVRQGFVEYCSGPVSLPQP